MTSNAGARLREKELLKHLADGLITERDKLAEMIIARNREVVRACDYYSLSPDEVSEASGISTQRVNQILAEGTK